NETVAPPLDAERVREWLEIPVEELAERSPLPLTVLPTKEDVHRHFAGELFDEARTAAAAGEELAVIVPLGPKAHCSLLARMVNEAGLSLEHVTNFSMDQWLDWQARPLSWEHPFNLEAYFPRHFLDPLAHAQRALAGNVFGIPPMGVTLGMRDLLGASRIRLYTDGGAWKLTILRILLFSEPTVDYRVTLVHEHPDVHVVADAASAACPP